MDSLSGFVTTAVRMVGKVAHLDVEQDTFLAFASARELKVRAQEDCTVVALPASLSSRAVRDVVIPGAVGALGKSASAWSSVGLLVIRAEGAVTAVLHHGGYQVSVPLA